MCCRFYVLSGLLLLSCLPYSYPKTGFSPQNKSLYIEICPIFKYNCSRAYLKNHSRNLHSPLCGIFHPNSVAVARYGALIRAKYPTNCDAHLTESLFQTHSKRAYNPRTNLRLFCYIFLIQTSTALSPLPDKCIWNRIYSKGGILLWQHGKISTLLLLTANLPN